MMYCSTIIPTIGRPTVSRAVQSVLNQAFDEADFEVIVVNDSGRPLPEEEWQKSSRVRLIHTNRHNRSVARNAGAAIAKGRYLHFLDDDDWMLPGAFKCFWQMSKKTKAAWLYGAFRFVDDYGQVITELFPDEVGNCLMQLIAWEWLPLQASWIESKAFFTIGGFAPLSSLLGGFEDIHLSREIALNYDMARADQVVTSIRVGDESSTTNYVDMFMQNRQSREKVINARGAFSRMRDSAHVSSKDSSYWNGKIVYYYMTSIKWNLQRMRLFTAFSRFAYSLTSFISSGRHIFSSNYWRGLLKPHYPRMGIALQETGTDYLYSTTRSKLKSQGQL